MRHVDVHTAVRSAVRATAASTLEEDTAHHAANRLVNVLLIHVQRLRQRNLPTMWPYSALPEDTFSLEKDHPVREELLYPVCDALCDFAMAVHACQPLEAQLAARMTFTDALHNYLDFLFHRSAARRVVEGAHSRVHTSSQTV